MSCCATFRANSLSWNSVSAFIDVINFGSVDNCNINQIAKHLDRPSAASSFCSVQSTHLINRISFSLLVAVSVSVDTTICWIVKEGMKSRKASISLCRYWAWTGCFFIPVNILGAFILSWATSHFSHFFPSLPRKYSLLSPALVGVACLELCATLVELSVR